MEQCIGTGIMAVPKKKIDKLFQNRKLNKRKDCFKPVSFKKTINLSWHISFGNSLSVSFLENFEFLFACSLDISLFLWNSQ
jgi:hypothetical protein